jgi:acetyl esterase
MPLHPDAQAFLDLRASLGTRPVEELSVEEARAQSIRLSATLPRHEVARVREVSIPGNYGEIPARAYYPNGKENLPIIVYFHGGGWVVGNLETVDAVCRDLANATQALVVSVNYHHGPEYKFPAAAEDAYAATRWVSEHASEIGGDASRVAVMGNSAGGGLAATTALMARDRGGPGIAFQLLQVPVLDMNFDTASYHENATGYGLTRAGMQWFWNQYMRDPEDGTNPYASPIRAADLANLPPAFIQTAENDPLRDEGAAYARRLSAAGVPVKYVCYEGMVHGFLGARAIMDQVDALKDALAVL